MGQRLCINIYYNTEMLANAYYHWSAYTQTAIDLTIDVLKALNRNGYKKDSVLGAVLALEATGAGLPPNSESYRMMKRKYDNFSPSIYADRNNGIIATTYEEMIDMQSTSEYEVFIYLSSNNCSVKDYVDFRVVNEYGDIEDYRDAMCYADEDEGPTEDSIYKIDYDNRAIPLENSINSLKTMAEDLGNEGVVMLDGGYIIQEVS